MRPASWAKRTALDAVGGVPARISQGSGRPSEDHPAASQFRNLSAGRRRRPRL